MRAKAGIVAACMAAVVLAGCEDHDGGSRGLRYGITVVNETPSAIHVHQISTSDTSRPDPDEARLASVDIEPGREADLAVEFRDETSTARLEVTKDGVRRIYHVEHGEQRLIIREEHFADGVP